MLFSEVGLAWQVQCICDGQKANLKAIHVESRASLGPTSARELIKVIARTDAEEGESYHSYVLKLVAKIHLLSNEVKIVPAAITQLSLRQSSPFKSHSEALCCEIGTV